MTHHTTSERAKYRRLNFNSKDYGVGLQLLNEESSMLTFVLLSGVCLTSSLYP